MKIFSNPKLMAVLNSLAVMVVATSANSACSWLFHQPKFPEGAEKFKR
ncbi:MAG: cyclic lactone autoinducer peptide [Lachnospiraceae bacterium]|nr:cyclic lactone autoinducer peptide [Lachnospiraceae bacterium]